MEELSRALVQRMRCPRLVPTGEGAPPLPKSANRPTGAAGPSLGDPRMGRWR